MKTTQNLFAPFFGLLLVLALGLLASCETPARLAEDLNDENGETNARAGETDTDRAGANSGADKKDAGGASEKDGSAPDSSADRDSGNAGAADGSLSNASDAAVGNDAASPRDASVGANALADAGKKLIDAGESVRDAGQNVQDAGRLLGNTDSGTALRDAATSLLDAGRSLTDAGTAARDAAVRNNPDAATRATDSGMRDSGALAARDSGSAAAPDAAQNRDSGRPDSGTARDAGITRDAGTATSSDAATREPEPVWTNNRILETAEHGVLVTAPVAYKQKPFTEFKPSTNTDPNYVADPIASVIFKPINMRPVPPGGAEFMVAVFPKREGETLREWTKRTPFGDSFFPEERVRTKNGYEGIVYNVNDLAALPAIHVMVDGDRFVYGFYWYDSRIPWHLPPEQIMMQLNHSPTDYYKVPNHFLNFIMNTEVQ